MHPVGYFTYIWKADCKTSHIAFKCRQGPFEKPTIVEEIIYGEGRCFSGDPPELFGISRRIAFTRIPLGPSSMARVLVKPTAAHFDVR